MAFNVQDECGVDDVVALYGSDQSLQHTPPFQCVTEMEPHGLLTLLYRLSDMLVREYRAIPSEDGDGEDMATLLAQVCEGRRVEK